MSVTQIALRGLPICCLLLAIFAFGENSFAASTMSVSSNGSVNISVSPGSTGTGSDELILTTNCSSGYMVYASATSSSASTSLSNGSGSEISASSSTLASPGALSDNTWGIANAASYAEGKFAGLPTYANMATTSLTSGNSAVSATKIPVYYGVKVNSSITPGTYTGNVLYTAMVNSACYTYTISYDANGGSGTMNDQELPMNTETALSGNSFSRDGYSFLGWGEDKDAKVATFTDAQSVTGETFGISENGANVTLYAIWEEDTVVEMQNWLGCGKLADNQIVTLLDTRNNVKYKVKKVVAVEDSTTPDYAQCWMVENLRLTPGTTDPGTSEVTSGTLATTASTSQAAGSITFSDSGFDTTTAGTTGLRAVYRGDGTRGAYYTWSAAQVVCPAGWHLPSGGLSSEFADLDIALGGTGSGRSNANTYSTFMGTDLTSGQNMAFPLAGDYDGSSSAGASSFGAYWSSTQYSVGYGYYLFLYSTNRTVNPQTYSDKHEGRSVRCVANQTAEIDGIMQNWTGCDSLADNEIVSLLDTRNNVIYKVKKVVAVSGSATPDYAECWMVENLRLTPGTADPGTASDTYGTLVTMTDTSQAAGSVTFTSSGFNSSTAGTTGLRAVYKGDTTHGAYYTWSAAQVVCPAGWHLPSGGSGGEFYDLDVALGGTGADRDNANTYSLFTNAIDGITMPGLAFPLAGSYDDNSLGGSGTYGLYWSSTQYNSSNGYSLVLSSNRHSVNQPKNTYKWYGISVRCAADRQTMQDFSCATDLTAGKITTLVDSRDGQKYKVYKFPSYDVPAGWEGMCLMQSDLSLGMVDGPNASGSDTAISEVFADHDLTLRSTDTSFYSDTDSINTSINRKTEWVIKYGGIMKDDYSYDWSATNSSSNKQYIIDMDRGYYSWGAALVACPKGWRLPTDIEYGNVVTSLGNSQAGSDAIRRAPFYFQYGGYFTSTKEFSDQGINGYYWSATGSSSITSSSLKLSSDTLSRSSVSMSRGHSVRCVAQ